LHPLRDGTFAVGVAFPFGQVDAAALRALAELAPAFAPAPGRALLAVGLGADEVADFRTHAAALGFITEAGDPRRSVAACPGSPACAAALMPARAIAETALRCAGSLLDGSVTLHLSGCAKGCAHPAPATITLTATPM